MTNQTTTERRVCTLPECDAPLRSSNTIGYCRTHRQLAPAVAEYQANYRETNREDRNWRHKQGQYGKKSRLKNKYGMTVEEYDGMVAAQGGGCAICGYVPEGLLYVDHNHETGAVRSLLCHMCNTGLGMFFDDLERVLLAAEYLRSHMVE